MRAWIHRAVLTAAIAWAVPAFADVRVTFVHPERYTDAEAYPQGGVRGTLPVQAELRQHLQRLGRQYLKPGQSLNVEITDVDLAGTYEPLRFGLANVRVMRSVTWPRINLHYALRQNGRMLASRQETLVEQIYQVPTMYSSSDPLRYEKSMLDDWFRRRFGSAEAGR